MVDAGIHDGDFAVIQRCEDAENGAIVVALVEDREVTLKRLRRRGASIALEPANQEYEIGSSARTRSASRAGWSG